MQALTGCCACGCGDLLCGARGAVDDTTDKREEVKDGARERERPEHIDDLEGRGVVAERHLHHLALGLDPDGNARGRKREQV